MYLRLLRLFKTVLDCGSLSAVVTRLGHRPNLILERLLEELAGTSQAPARGPVHE